MQAHATYEEGLVRHRKVLAGLDGQSRGLGAARLAVAALAIALVGGMVWGGFGLWAWGALGALAFGFLALVVVHARVSDAAERAKAAVRFHTRGLARLALDWPSLAADHQRYRTADHPFTADLDVFGRASLMQLIDATETRFGQDRLASFLAREDRGDWPADALARQSAARDLADRSAFREGLATAGAILDEDKPDPSGLVAWAESSTPPPSALLRALAWVQPIAVFAVLAVGTSLGLPGGIVTGIGVAAIAAGLASTNRFGPMLEAVSSKESAVTRWRAMLAAIEREAFTAPRLAALRATLAGSGVCASDELARLERIVGFADARHNEVFRFFIGPLLMWDVHCAIALHRWRSRAGGRLRGWLDALAETEALASLGGFAFEHREFAWPELVAEPIFDAGKLGHPLIAGDRRVGNGVRLPSRGHALVVTGSNM
ncbi:MAG TPA: hypothetical protein VHV30_14795, partial [Polyangiaceae bacterium]|nr:hypothetical protein [Polyangiaceae bacterium]